MKTALLLNLALQTELCKDVLQPPFLRSCGCTKFESLKHACVCFTAGPKASVRTARSVPPSMLMGSGALPPPLRSQGRRLRSEGRCLPEGLLRCSVGAGQEALSRGVGAGSAGSGCRARRRRRRRRRQSAGRRRSPPAFEPGQSRGGERGRGRRQAMTSERPERIRWESRGSGAAEPGVSD